MSPRKQPRAELQFPIAGIDRSVAADKQPPGTTSEATNVLALDTTTNYQRGAKRPGFKKTGSAALASGHIQDLEQLTYANPGLVTFTPAATGGGFTGSEEWAAASGNGTTILAETYDAEGNRYAIDLTGSLIKFSLDGKMMWQVTIAKKHPAHVFRGIAIGPNGDVYVGVGRMNSLSTTTIELEYQKKGQEKARIYRFQQVKLAEDVNTAQLKWEYVTGRYVVDMKIAGGYLVTVEEDVEIGWSYTIAYQSLVAGAPTVRWKTRIGYPANCLAVSRDGTVYVGCEPALGAAAASAYGQSRRNAQAQNTGTVGPVKGWGLEDLKKLGWRVWRRYRADAVTGSPDTDAELENGAEVEQWTDLSGNSGHLTVPAGTFSFPSATGVPAEGPRLIKRGPNNLPEVRFHGITGLGGLAASLRFQGLVSEPADSTAEQSESNNRTMLPSYDNSAFMVVMLIRPNSGNLQRQALFSQDYKAESIAGATSDRTPVAILLNQSITTSPWSTTASSGQVGLLDPVYVGGSGGANATSPPNGLSKATDFQTPLSISGLSTQNGGLALPHGYMCIGWLCDGKFTGSFQDDATYKGTMSIWNVNGTVIDRYGGHKKSANTDVYSMSTLGFSHNSVVDFAGSVDSFEPFIGGVVEIIVLNRYDKDPITGLHSNTNDAATADPVIVSHLLLPNDNTTGNIPGDSDDQVSYSVTDQIAGTSSVSSDEMNLIMASVCGEWGVECMPIASDAAGPPYNYKANVFAKDPCVNRLASGIPPQSTDIAIGGPRDPNWINYPHGMVVKLNGDDGSQVWVAADYTSAGNNAGFGFGIAVVQDYGDDESAPSTRKLVSYGPKSNFQDAYARVLTDSGETVTVGSTISLLAPGAVVFRDRYMKCGADQFGNAFLPGCFLSNYSGDAYSVAVVKKDGTVRVKYDVDGTYHYPCYSAQPDPVSPNYPSSVDKLARYIVLALHKDAYNSAPAIGATTANCLRKIKIVNASAPSGLPRLTEYLGLDAGHVKKYVESSGALTGPTALSPAGPQLSTTSTYGKIIVGLERAYILDGQTYWIYDPKLSGDTIKLWKAKKGRIPERCLLGCEWLGAIVLARPSDSPTELFMSRIGDPLDWDFNPPQRSATQASRLQNRAGPHADPITAVIRLADDLLLVGGERSMSRLTGHPEQGGRLDNISKTTGILFDAWTEDNEGHFYIVTSSMDVLVADRTGAMQSISGSRITEALQSIDLSKYRLQLVWVSRHNLLMLLQVPWSTSDLGTVRTFWVWQRSTNAWFEGDTETAGVQPTCGLTPHGDTSAIRRTLFGSEDGWLRTLDPSITYDEAADGTKKRIYSRVLMGPLRVSDPDEQVSISHVTAVLGDTDSSSEHAQGGADLELYVSSSPDVMGPPVAALALGPGHNPTYPVNARGCLVWARISNASVDERCAINSVTVDAALGGKVAL